MYMIAIFFSLELTLAFVTTESQPNYHQKFTKSRVNEICDKHASHCLLTLPIYTTTISQ